MILMCINDDHANDRSGTIVRSIDDADVSFDLPPWVAAPSGVFEVDYKGIYDVTYSINSDKITLDLGRTDLTRTIIVTGDSSTREPIAVAARHDIRPEG
jgi:hypothetical protein